MSFFSYKIAKLDEENIFIAKEKRKVRGKLAKVLKNRGVKNLTSKIVAEAPVPGSKTILLGGLECFIPIMVFGQRLKYRIPFYLGFEKPQGYYLKQVSSHGLL